MVGTSKILTVSYGTFSCTLEGFDDSFSTMKAIAEYFRDLAADDRYFGAEPPTPDAEMLARIAEREIARRVEARTDGTDIVLRASQALPQAAPPPRAEEPVAAEVDEAEDWADEPAAPGAETAGADFPAADVDDEDDLDEDEDEDDVLFDAAPSARDLDDEDIFVSDDEEEDAPAATMPPAVQRPAPRQVLVSPQVADEDEAPVIMPKAEIPAHPDADSVAAKLQRIRAVVSKQPSALAASDDGAEDEVPPMAPAADPSAISALARGDAAETDVADEPDVAETPAPTLAESAASAPASTGPVRARVIRMRRADFDRAVARGQIEAEEDAAEVAAPVAEDPAPKAQAFDAETDEDIAAYEADAPDLTAEEPADLEDEAEYEGGSLWSADQAEDEAAAADPEDEVASAEDIADLERLDGVADEPAAGAHLSDEDEAELMAELAAVEREMGLRSNATQPEEDADNYDAAGAQEDDEEAGWATADARAEDEGADEEAGDDDHAEAAELEDEDSADLDETETARDEAEAEEAAEPVNPRKVRRVQMLHGSPDADEAAVSRIMSKAEAHLSEPEANRRRDAIAQLKAAVAAKEAARSLGETDEDDGAVETAFRKDLREVVRPTRPQAAGQARTERPRAAPLKLVAAQRVDVPAAAPKGPVAPVRPRRVSIETAAPANPGAAAAAAAKSGSFADFAAEMGAHSLGDLLEAAAAYTAFVEGSEDFSRPQLINKVRETSDQFSREDGLRSFGTLLREGRIQKVRNGRFQISDETRFHPERRAG